MPWANVEFRNQPFYVPEGVVLEVDDKAALERVPYWQQGAIEMYSRDNVTKREHNREDPEVRRALDAWWTLASGEDPDMRKALEAWWTHVPARCHERMPELLLRATVGGGEHTSGLQWRIRTQQGFKHAAQGCSKVSALSVTHHAMRSHYTTSGYLEIYDAIGNILLEGDSAEATRQAHRSWVDEESRTEMGLQRERWRTHRQWR